MAPPESVAETAARVLLVTRPAAEAAAFSAALAARGFAALCEPLLAILPLHGVPLDLAAVQAILATSRNGVRALANLTPQREIRLLAVGDSTAALARAEGFVQVLSAGGDVLALAALAERELRAEDGTLLHVSGLAAAGDLARELERRGFTCRRVALYEARAAAALSAPARTALKQGGLAGAVFFSPRTAATFVRLAEAAGLAASCASLTAYCLSGAVAAEAARLRWRRIETAARPEQAALLALLNDEVGTEPE